MRISISCKSVKLSQSGISFAYNFILMLKHHGLRPRFTYLLVLSIFISILTGCSSEYNTIGPTLEGKESITGGTMLLLAGRPGGVGTSDAIGTLARFNSPRGIAVYGDTLYVTDKSNHTIRKIDLYTKSVTTIAGYPGRPGVNDGIGSNARFYFPEGIATDGVYLYVADTGNQAIRKIEIDGGVKVDNILQLKEAGAEGIIEYPLNKVIY